MVLWTAISHFRRPWIVCCQLWGRAVATAAMGRAATSCSGAAVQIAGAKASRTEGTRTKATRAPWLGESTIDLLLPEVFGRPRSGKIDIKALKYYFQTSKDYCLSSGFQFLPKRPGTGNWGRDCKSKDCRCTTVFRRPRITRLLPTNHKEWIIIW